MSTLIIGATLLVVHDAFEIIKSSALSWSSLTPSTMLFISLSVGGADRITFLTPDFKCLVASFFDKK